MNPNDPSNLDPKLRETYERIMGTPPPSAQTQQQEPTQQIPPIQQPQQAPKMQTQELIQPQTPPTLTPPPLPQDDITQSPLSMETTFVNPNPSASEVTEGDSPVKSPKKRSFTSLFLGVGIFVFFVVYAVIWSKVFGLF